MVGLLPIKIMQNDRLWRTLLLSLCVLIFMFVLHAKTAVYNGDAPAKVTPSTASKLWLSGQKMEVHSADSGTRLLFWMGTLCLLYGVHLRRAPRVQGAFTPPAPRNFALRHLRRFLRPPPIPA
jgi:hypothetical protein